ncbi:STAS domain-containing protein [Pseudonocardia phyllosphaerae]|uniref:STAS domain-containing protein n=1 Tax=Pseudonocardia phyllosphaerae TaxID=3390502 RepID=UPI0039793273
MTERTDGPGGMPDPGGVSDATGALALEAVPHPSGPVMVHASGEVDTVTAPFLAEQLQGWIAAAPKIVLDLSRVSFIGSAGLSVLLEGHAEAERNGVGLQLACGEARQVRRLLQITGTLEHLDVVDPIPQEVTPLFAVPDPEDEKPS